MNTAMTLSAEVEAIKAQRISKSKKREALFKLGLTAADVQYVLCDENQPTNIRGSFTFGVEIECGVNRYNLAEPARRNGMAYEYQHYNHTDRHDIFKFVHDGSLTVENSIECVSPVLKGRDGKAALKAAVKTLNEAGARVNSSCGLHVHIGAANLTPMQYCNVFVNYAYLESVIDSFMARSRRDSRWCRSIKPRLVELEAAQTHREIAMAMSYDRYFKVNSQSYERHKTIEFRVHQGTTNYEKIDAWVAFCGKLVLWSKKHRLTSEVQSIDDIPFLTAKEKSFFKRRAEQLA